ncbi:hypothetical protein SAMD00019534_082060 [Acytostelium subglobosum LB1]|uniref:hypothetical protein n=1 Tax=Acytostelium subglobosum LB1 TaxID=1410327 RepID=UPI000644FADA|nr:hypothetical protein SAMD00019534_082060 [Acytostelium subglobosum LB1]GAM25031.1 hypothetical protein SAMD00019534_082060 [Acytostelium subglobosum LB1]|eukprot:XP_012752120.1 hypothetical protein SAMD00019534_082060 [Acytostelium subglobosum LB1]
MVRPELKLFKKPEKTRQKQELVDFLRIPSNIITDYINRLNQCNCRDVAAAADIDGNNKQHPLKQQSTQQQQQPGAIRDLFVKFLQTDNQNDQSIFVKRLESTLSKRATDLTSTPTPLPPTLIDTIVNLCLYILFELRSSNLQINKSLTCVLNVLVATGDSPHLSALLQHLDDVLPTDVDQTIIYHAHALTILVELKHAAAFFAGDGCLRSVRALAHLLTTQLTSMEKSGTLYMNDFYSDCDYTLRALVALFGAFKPSIQTLVRSHAQPMRALISALDRILVAAQYPKQIIALTAYLLTECITLAATNASDLQQQVIGHFIRETPSTLELFLDAMLQMEHGAYLLRFNIYPHLSRVSVFRGLCLSSQLAWLTQPLNDTANESLFLNHIYLALCDSCTSAVDVFGRVASLEYLHLWYETLLALLNQLSQPTLQSIVHIEYDLFFKDYLNRALDIIFSNWESTISSVPTQLNDIFDCLLDVHYRCTAGGASGTGSSSASTHGQLKESGTAPAFIPDITCRLIDEPWSQKGKYALLKSIVDREGALFMFTLRGNFLRDVLVAMSDHTICNSAKGFLEQLMEALKKEVSKRIRADSRLQGDVKKQDDAIQEECELFWLVPLLNVLTEADDASCAKIIMYGTPSFLKVFPQSLVSILDVLNKDSTNRQLTSATQHLVIDNNVSLRISLSVLNTARQLSILELGEILKNNYNTIKRSLYHQDDSLRMIGLELVCVSPKNTERPTRVEIRLLKKFLSLALKSSSPFIRNHTNSILEKFWFRLRESYSKVFRTTQVNKSKGFAGLAGEAAQKEAELYMSNEELSDFLNWCASLFIASLYPGAPYPRKMLPLDAFSNFIDAWSVEQFSEKVAVLPLLKWLQERSTVFSSQNTLILLHNLWDQYDRCREVASSVLLRFPSPLPGFSEERPIQALVMWGLKLACSPKARECDTGAMVLRLYMDKYVKRGVCVPTFDVTTSDQPPVVLSSMPPNDAIIHFIRQITRVLRSQVSVANHNLLEAAKCAPMHGLILSIRYLLASSVDFAKMESQPQQKEKLRGLVTELVDLMFAISTIVLRVVADSAPEGYTPSQDTALGSFIPKSLPSGILYDDDERLASRFATLSTSEKDSTTMEELLAQVGGSGPGDTDDQDGGGDEADDSFLPESSDQLKGSAGQIITVCSWLSMKQLSLCLGTILDRVKFPASMDSKPEDTLLSVEQISEIGKSFVHILLNTRHKGAIEKAYLGFQVLCSRLMGSTHPTLYALPASWIESLFKRVQEQSLSITRRSAGLPFAFTGLLTGESTHQKKIAGPLLQSVISQLLKLANGGDDTDNKDIIEEVGAAEKKVYLPQVHSINILRSIFRNKTMTNELDQHFSETMMAIVRAYSSPSWSVRNAATMAFSTMVDKIVGVKKVRDETSHLNTTTFHYFFGHMPALHPFLLEHFGRSLDAINAAKGQALGSDQILQSSIYAILVLFARLQPSNMSNPADTLSPTPFIPYISQCCSFSNFMVRQIAARALVPFIASRDVLPFISNLVDSIKSPSEAAGDFNMIHGVLLQIYHLLHAHIPSVHSIKEREAMVVAAVLALRPTLWIVNQRIVPLAYVIILIFNDLNTYLQHIDLSAQDGLVTITLQEIIQQALLALRMSHKSACDHKEFSLPLFSAYIKEAGYIALHTIDTILVKQPEPPRDLKMTVQESAQQLISMLMHSEYEIRLETIKYLLRNIDDIIKCEVVDRLAIQKLMLHMLDSETNLPCRKRALRILPRLGLDLPLDGGKLLDLLHSIVMGKSGIKSDAIILFGHAYKQLILSSTATTSSEMNNRWFEMLKMFSNSDQPHELRLAITEAINAASAILSKIEDSRVAIEMWLALSTLLEDDEESIREMAAINTWKILNASRTQTQAQTQDYHFTCDVTKSMESIHSHLVKTFANDAYLVQRYKAVLAMGVFHLDNIFASEFRSSVVLFDKEEDNYYHEKMVTLQIIANHMCDIVSNTTENKNDDDWTKHLLLETKRAMQYTTWIRETSEANKQSVWNHWLTYNQEVFLPLYMCLCSIHAMLSNNTLCNQHANHIAKFIQDTDTVFQAVPTHPLLTDLLYKLHTKFVQSSATSTTTTPPRSSHYDQLNMYFLTSLSNK